MRDLNCLRRYFLIAVVLLFAATGIATAQLKTAPRLRVIVKVRAKLAKDVEASLPMQTMVVTAGQPASASVQSFMNRHRGHRLAPVYPAIVRAKKQRGVTDLQFATSVRQKFPVRANRLRGGFRPPEISRTYVLEVDSTDKTVLDKLLSDLKTDPDVEFAEPDHLVSVHMTPNDPYFFSSGTWGQAYDDLWGSRKSGLPQRGIRAPEPASPLQLSILVSITPIPTLWGTCGQIPGKARETALTMMAMDTLMTPTGGILLGPTI